MCTAISFLSKDHYFGRNLDLEYSYDETVTITPRNFTFHFRHQEPITNHYALIGMAYVQDNYPLYYEATNEKGLSMAGLNFPKDAVYKSFAEGKDNITPFEFIPWILSQCESVNAARELLLRINIIQEDYSSGLPLTPLHWIISDSSTSITVESVEDGLQIYNNPIGILTNNPAFDLQMFHLDQFTSDLIPGDLSSTSRFLRAAFVKKASVCSESEDSSVSQFFHILDSVSYQRGRKKGANASYMITIYSCCCNTDKGIYYYKTYDNCQLSAVNMFHENLDCDHLVSYSLCQTQQIYWHN